MKKTADTGRKPRNPRVLLTLTPEAHQALSELSEALSKPMSAVIRDYMQLLIPAMRSTAHVAALEAQGKYQQAEAAKRKFIAGQLADAIVEKPE